jgi:hypothetical protein
LIAVGERAPDATVWLNPRESAALSELWRESTVLFLFYLFDWSST